MSADNWTICPRCKKKAADDMIHEVQELQNLYGSVPAEEYMAKAAALQKSHPIALGDTLREDYELGIWSDGKFHISYGCSCEVCKFTFSFKEVREVAP